MGGDGPRNGQEDAMTLPDCMMPDGAEPCRGYGELRDEVERLRERLGPHGLEVVMIAGAGHYVNATVKAEIERLERGLKVALDENRKLAGEIEPMLRAINEASNQGVRWPKRFSDVVSDAAKLSDR